MSIFYTKYSLDQLNERNKNTMVEHCGVELTEITEDTLTGTLPAEDRNKQPFGIVHGGANCVLAETLGSIAANLTCNPETTHAVGLSITTNHIKAVRNGLITGIAKPVHLGRSTQIWHIKTYNSANELTANTQLTMAIIERAGKKS